MASLGLPWAVARGPVGVVGSVPGGRLPEGVVVGALALAQLLTMGLVRRWRRRTMAELVLAVCGVGALVPMLIVLVQVRSSAELSRLTDGMVRALPGRGLWLALGADIAGVALSALTIRRQVAGPATSMAGLAPRAAAPYQEPLTPPGGTPPLPPQLGRGRGLG